MPEDSIDHINFEELNSKAISKPIVTHLYTADPSAHVFENKIYIYPSHDVDAGEAFDDLGSHFAIFTFPQMLSLRMNFLTHH